MVQDALTLGEALSILEINSIDDLTESEIAKQKKKAYVRWHPDKIAHTGDKNKIELYTAKTKLIEPAVQLLQLYLKGEYDPRQKFDDTGRSYEYEEPLEVLRRNAPMMQAELSKVWSRVVETQFMKTEEETVLSEGHTLESLLRDDLQSDIVPLGITLMLHGFVIAMIIGIVGGIWSIFSSRYGGFIIGVANYGFPVHFLICILVLLPLSRFWLPTLLARFVDWYSTAMSNIIPTDNAFWNIVEVIGMVVGYIVKYVVVYPLYFVAIALVGQKVVRRVVVKQAYYANLASWYIEQLIRENPQSFSDEQLYHLGHAYSAFKTVPQP